MRYLRFYTYRNLNDVVGLPSLIIKSLIVSTSKIWSAVYIKEKWIWSSETSACTIRECEIVRNILRVTLTCPLISWCSGAANVIRTPRFWHLYWKSLEVNCVPAYAEIIYKSHQPNSSIFPNISWNIPILSITSSVLIIYIT